MSDSDTKPENVVSLSGSPIYRHDDPRPWSPPTGEEFIEEISTHIQEHLGPVDWVFHELVSDKVHIDVHVVKPSPDFPFVRLVTSGMSDLPMHTPEDDRIPKYAELVVTLPGDWKLTQDDFKDENWYWPIRLIKTLARLPHDYDTWLGWGHTVPNGDPPKPYSDRVKFCGAIVLSPVTAPEPFARLTIDGVKDIHFFSVVPLYEGEMNLKLRSGTDELLRRFDKSSVSDIVNLDRRDATAKRFGLW